MTSLARRVRAIILGPDDPRIREPFPPTVNTRPPTNLDLPATGDGTTAWLAGDNRPFAATVYKTEADYLAAKAALAAARKQEEPVTEPRSYHDDNTDDDPDVVTPGPYLHADGSESATPRSRQVAAVPMTERPIDPVTDSGVHAAIEDDLPAIPVSCTHCGSRTYRPVNDILRESTGLISDGDGVTREVYRRLLDAAPELAALFPADLITAATGDTGSPGAIQRDRLFGAVVALADNYGGGRQATARLRTALEAFGRHHAAFPYPDGTVSPATPEQYLVVRDVLFGVLIDIAGDAWRPEYTTAWMRAYQHAMSVMLNAQEQFLEENPNPMPRSVRATR